MLLVCLIWGINFSVTKLAIAQIPPLPFTAIRFALASLLLWLVLRATEGPVRAARRRSAPAGGPRASWATRCYQLAFMLGLAQTTRDQQLADPGDRADRGRRRRGAPGPRADHAGACGGASRWARSAWCWSSPPAASSSPPARSRGDLLTVLAVFCWAGYTVGLRTLPAGFSSAPRHHRDHDRRDAGTRARGVAGAAAAGVGRGAGHGMGRAGLRDAAVAGGGVLLWNRSVQAVGGTRTAIYMCVTPLVAVGAAWVMLGEHAQPLQGVGAVLIVAGVLLTRW